MELPFGLQIDRSQVFDTGVLDDPVSVKDSLVLSSKSSCGRNGCFSASLLYLLDAPSVCKNQVKLWLLFVQDNEASSSLKNF